AANDSVTYQVSTSIDNNITADPDNEARVAGFEIEIDNDPTNSDGVGGTLDDDPLLNNVSIATVDVPLATITVAKDDGNTTVNAGETLTYDITIANVSDDDALNVVAFDTLPAGVTFVSGTFTVGSGEGANPIVLIDDVTDPNDGEVRINVGTLTGDAVVGNRESVTASITVMVNEALPDGQSPLDNLVTVNADNAPTVTDNDQTTVNREVDLTIVKEVVGTRTPDDRTDGDPNDDITNTVAPFDPVAGGFVTYQITATNLGPSQARGVTITDTLEPGLTFVAGSLDAMGSGVTLQSQVNQTLTFAVPDLDPDDTSTTADDIVFTFEVGIASSEFGTVPNAATIASTDPEVNPDPNSNTSTVNITPSAQVNLDIAKTVDVVNQADDTTAVPGRDTVVYTITVTHENDSVSDAANVTVTDLLPAGLSGVMVTAADSTSSTFNDTTRVLTVQYASIPVGDTRTITIEATVDSDATGDQTNDATVTFDGGTDDADVTFALTPQFDLQIDKTVQGGDANLDAGETVVFDIVVTHDLDDDGTEADDGQSFSDATNVVITDTLPTGLTFVSATSGGAAVTPTSTTNGVIVFPAFDLGFDAGGASEVRTLTVTATVDADADGQLTNTAAITSTDAGETDTVNNNSDTAILTASPLADISVTKLDDATNSTVQAGETLVYTITVDNAGPSTAENIGLLDTLPAGVTFQSIVGPGITGNTGFTVTGAPATGQTITVANGGSLAADNATLVYTVTVTVNAGVTGDLINSVTVSTTTNEGANTLSNTATETTTINEQLSRISGTLFLDRDRDGIQDSDDPGVAGIDMELTGGDLTAPVIVQTDDDGYFLLFILSAGEYVVLRLGLPDETTDGIETPGTGVPGTPTRDGEIIDEITVTGADEEITANNFAVELIFSKRLYLS
ncbi:MAG: SdrD B-like domain-containing protein, partial [Planctomycetota bacterium]